MASFHINVCKPTFSLLIIASYSIVSMHYNLAYYILRYIQFVSYFFISSNYKEDWSKHPWTNIFKYMSNYSFLGVKSLSQAVCIFKIPIHVAKQPYKKLILILLPFQGIKMSLSSQCQRWDFDFFNLTINNLKIEFHCFWMNRLLRMNFFSYVYQSLATLFKMT